MTAGPYGPEHVRKDAHRPAMPCSRADSEFELLNHATSPCAYVDGLECTAQDGRATVLQPASVVEVCGIRFVFETRR